MIGITRYHISDGDHQSIEYVTYADHLDHIGLLKMALRRVDRIWEARNELSDLINTYKGQGVDAFDPELFERLNKIDDLFLAALSDPTLNALKPQEMTDG